MALCWSWGFILNMLFFEWHLCWFIQPSMGIATSPIRLDTMLPLTKSSQHRIKDNPDESRVHGGVQYQQ